MATKQNQNNRYKFSSFYGGWGLVDGVLLDFYLIL
jgi:hypothetical protein